jgi:pyrroloquinoline-quinone synthase
MDEILTYIKDINKIEANKYFVTLKRVPTLTSFLRSQKSFITAIDFWSRILASLLIHMPSDVERSIIVKNLWDEHGCGNPKKSHVETFKDFMKIMGYTEPVRIEYMKADEYCFKFVQGLNELCDVRLEPKDYGDNDIREKLIFAVAALGMIEYTYVTVSKCIHEYASRFIPSDLIPHYAVHETLDIIHATELFSLIEDNWSDEFNQSVKDGIVAGYQLLSELYSSMAYHLN